MTLFHLSPGLRGHVGQRQRRPLRHGTLRPLLPIRRRCGRCRALCAISITGLGHVTETDQHRDGRLTFPSTKTRPTFHHHGVYVHARTCACQEVDSRRLGSRSPYRHGHTMSLRHSGASTSICVLATEAKTASGHGCWGAWALTRNMFCEWTVFAD